MQSQLEAFTAASGITDNTQIKHVKSPGYFQLFKYLLNYLLFSNEGAITASFLFNSNRVRDSGWK